MSLATAEAEGPAVTAGGGYSRRERREPAPAAGSVGGMSAAVPPPVSAVSRGVRAGLLAVAWFQAVSALVGCAGLTFGGGLGIPLEWLEATPFDSYVWPGIVLGVVVGGAQAVALGAHHARYRLAWGLHAAAGIVMMVWIFVEISLLLVWSPLHGVYFVTGTVQVVLAVIALGAWPHPFLSR
ncbi:hypothetical protein LJR045_002816 [Microbacterium sp. LjRoot45]|uniref:hypothetical protein n=1 Tax=Microbacterium sp. LjRoot45 TaxID=3342329 RepID=UPI003ECD66ED